MVSFARLSSSLNGSSRLARYVSPETIRKALSAASSVLSISANAGNSQLSSGTSRQVASRW
jgi:hypothetical protein